MEEQVSVDGVMQERTELVPAAGKSALARRLAATWPVGQRLDELIHRARRYRRWKKDDIEALTYIPSKGYGSLPYSDADAEPQPRSGSTSMPSTTTCSTAPTCSAPSSSPARVAWNARNGGGASSG